MDQEAAVIGAGMMGHGFAIQFATNDKNVYLYDHKQSNIKRAKEEIKSTLGFLNESGRLSDSPESVIESINFTTDRQSAVHDADLVLETIPEDLNKKKGMFERLVNEAPADAVLCSNTSGIPITDIAADLEPDDRERVVGCHWWYPPYLLEPVEVIRGQDTSEHYFDRMVSFVESVDRSPILVEKDVPGFVWNRIQHAVIRECLHLVENDVASIEDINTAIRDGYATRTAAIGPFETMDIAGLDLVQTVSSNLYPHLDDDKRPSSMFDDYIDSGKRGIIDGEGFFDYDGSEEKVTENRDRRVVAIQNAIRNIEKES